jgi:two-component system phosphate regulon sensor histidine kinase PhoR
MREVRPSLVETSLEIELQDPRVVAELIAAIPVGLAMVHPFDLRIMAANPAMAGALDLVPEVLLGSRVIQVLPENHPLADPTHYREVTATARHLEGRLHHRGRTWRWFMRPLRGSGLVYVLAGLVEVGHDVEVDELREINQVKTDFLNLASHELRTPLGVINGYASLLSQGGLGEEHQRLAGVRIYEKGRQLTRLLTGLSQVARLDEIRTAPRDEPLDLAGLLVELVADAQRRYPDLAIEIDLTVPEALATGNAFWLRAAVREVLDNAARFRGAPGQVTIGLAEVPDAFVVTVRDDGFGIEESLHPLLFQRFTPIETDTNRHLVGLGIGLYLVREVLSAHGGAIEIQSDPSTGTIAILKVPK